MSLPFLFWSKPDNFDSWCLNFPICKSKCGKKHNHYKCITGKNCLNPYCTFMHDFRTGYESKNIIEEYEKQLDNFVETNLNLSNYGKQLKIKNSNLDNLSVNKNSDILPLNKDLKIKVLNKDSVISLNRDSNIVPLNRDSDIVSLNKNLKIQVLNKDSDIVSLNKDLKTVLNKDLNDNNKSINLDNNTITSLFELINNKKINTPIILVNQVVNPKLQNNTLISNTFTSHKRKHYEHVLNDNKIICINTKKNSNSDSKIEYIKKCRYGNECYYYKQGRCKFYH